MNPFRNPFARPSVEDGAGFFAPRRRPTGALRRAGGDDGADRVGAPGGFSKPVATTAEDLLSGIDVVYGKGNELPDSVVSVEKYVGEDLKPTWVVTVPGTQLGTLTTPFSMTSNFDLVQGSDADSTALVLAAMKESNIPAGRRSSSWGTRRAAWSPWRSRARWSAAQAGRSARPVRRPARADRRCAGRRHEPARRRARHARGDRTGGVSQLDGTENPSNPDRVTIHADLAAPGRRAPRDGAARRPVPRRGPRAGTRGGAVGAHRQPRRARGAISGIVSRSTTSGAPSIWTPGGGADPHRGGHTGRGTGRGPRPGAQDARRRWVSRPRSSLRRTLRAGRCRP
ncbi:hypothetical protein NKG05_14970 [Oerskovia sp. M15]